MQLKGKVVLITGASSGIGFATACAFAAAGSDLVLAARSKPALDALASQIKASGRRALAVSADITDPLAVESLAKTIEGEMGQLDILINNAGIGMNKSMASAASDDIKKVFAVNVFGPLLLIQRILPLLARNRRGIIANILSISGRRAMPNSGAYCASKAALELMSDSLRMEIASAGVKVVNIYPGFTRTDFGSHALGEKPRGRGKRFAISPERVAHAVIKAVLSEKRDAYVTFWDKLSVAATHWFPRLADLAMQRIWLR